jgi:hypothetical protein
MTVTMQSSTLSSLSPRITVYNAAVQRLAQAYASNSFGATVSVTITGVTAGQGYYFRASAAPGAGAVGAYGLLVNFGATPQAAIAPPNTVVAQQPYQGGGSIFLRTGGGGAPGDASDPPTLVRIGDDVVQGDALMASSQLPEPRLIVLGSAAPVPGGPTRPPVIFFHPGRFGGFTPALLQALDGELATWTGTAFDPFGTDPTPHWRSS